MPTTRTLQPEDRVSHYRVVGPLGAGGMGEVYLAQDETLERNVALKILPPELVRSEERVQRFVLEAKSASSLNHPNIVTIYEIGQDEPRSGSGEPSALPVYFISMELVSGKTLAAKIHEERIDLRTMLGYLAQAAEGVAKAHGAGIVHRDLKPGNIMVSDDGFAKVLDFGLAKLTEKVADPGTASLATRAADRTSEGAILGTVGYMSPEQVQGKSVDYRSDIFSFGCILYEATTRQRPFTADSHVETMHKILHEKPTPVEELNPEAPAELRRIIRRCLAKAPDQRVQSMKDLALELREIVEEFDSLSPSATSGSGSRPSLEAAPPKPRRPPLVPLLAGVGVVAVLGIALGWWALHRGGQKPAPDPFQSMRVTTQTNHGDVTDCVLSADGRYLAYIRLTSGLLSLRVQQVATGSDVEVFPPEKGVWLGNPNFSPDGNYIYYRKPKPDAPRYSALFQVPSLGGASQERAFDVDSRVTFSPDAKQICFFRGFPSKSMGALIVFDLESGQERELALVHGPAQISGDVGWSPDGKYVATVVYDPPPAFRSTVVLYEVGSGRRSDYYRLEGAYVSSLAWLEDGTGLVLCGNVLSAGVRPQIFLLGYPDREFRRITNDMNAYSAVSASTAAGAVAAVRETQLGNLWVGDVSGGAPRQITSASSSEHTPSDPVGAEGDLVLFKELRDQEIALWSLPTQGGEPKSLVPGAGHILNSKVGGHTVVFDRLEANRTPHLWSVDAQGSGLRQLTRGNGESLLDVSRDGRSVLFARTDTTRGVWKLSLAPAGEPVLLSATASSLRARFSPDGRHVGVYEDEIGADGLTQSVYKILPSAGGTAVGEIRPPRQINQVEWSPDGSALDFLYQADPAWNVYRLPLAGGAPVAVTRFTEGQLSQFAWSPDGTHLAVVLQMGPAQNVWVTAPDGSRPIQVTHFAAGEIFGAPTWMPEGDRLVVSAGTSGRDAILIRNFR